MFVLHKFKRLSKKKKQRIILIICMAIVGLLVELIGHIPGDSFNGWIDVFESLGMPQTYVAPEGEMEVHFIDVGNADCILVRQGAHNLLIDAGEPGDDDIIMDYLDRHGVEKLDLVVATHPHADHIGSMTDVIESIPIDRFVMSFMSKEPTTGVYLSMLEALDQRKIPVDEAIPGTEYELGTARLLILAPYEEASEANAVSVVTRLTFGDRHFVFTGDAEAKIERQMLAKRYNLKADVLKVGHHGSRYSTSDVFLAEVDPKYAVITCGPNNSYEHPHTETVERLGARAIEVYRSDLHGDVVFTTDGYQLTARTEKGD